MHLLSGQLSGVFEFNNINWYRATLASDTQIQVDGTVPILNVTTDYMVAGNDINSAVQRIPALLVVTAIDTTDVGNVLITLNKSFNTSTIGNEFTFTKALVAADGGYENNDSSWNNGNVFDRKDSSSAHNAVVEAEVESLIIYKLGSGGVVSRLWC